MNNNQTSQKLTFLELINKYKIEIPIIQRDYAQGRKGKEELRKNFLGALYNAITKEVPLELDFVYGSVKDNVLQPLDGQQRLTTLFLLHWYIAIKEKKLDEVKNQLTKFTYETRSSSREFCYELANKGIVMNDILNPSELIIDSSWFYLSWKRDPTIKSMLTMLDSIHHKFGDEIELWDKLKNISFQYIELQNFGLSDDLYIKMNARGKALTEFENFKAKFEQYIEKKNWEKEGELTKTFSNKIDTLWTDLFWNFRNKDEKSKEFNLFDNGVMNFISGIAISNYAKSLEIEKNTDLDTVVKNELIAKSNERLVTEESVKKERVERRIVTLFNNPRDLKPEDFPNEDSFRYLKNCFEKYAEKQTDNYCNSELFPKSLNLWDYCTDDSSIFKILISEKLTTYKQRVLFYAQTTYLIKINEFNSVTFSDWMRVVRNIIQNSTIDSASTFISAIGLINKLSNGCDEIYQYLSNGCNEIYQYLSKENTQSKFASEQVIEEIQKAKIVKISDDNKSVIHDIEDTNFCKGKIDFALFCIDYEVESSSCETFDRDRLEKIFTTIKNNFEDVNTKLSDDFKRAFLTVSNSYYDVWSEWSYSFESHKKWLLVKNDDLRKYFALNKASKRNCLKSLFILLNNGKNYRQIIDDYKIPEDMPNWKNRLIKEDKLLDGATFILVPNDNSFCYLAWQQRPSKNDQVRKIQ